MIWLVTGTVIMALGLLLLVAGLDVADKYARVIGALGSLAALGLSLSVRAHRSSPADPSREETEPAAGQQVHASAIGGDAVQVRGVGGNVRIGRALPPQPVTGSPQPPTVAIPRATSPGPQSVTNAQIGGSSAQISQVAGDVDVDWRK
ncbi:hypothetical protein ABGB17_01685 [Sphaerisporangium sp. B11E5]|uniref:hypothetical protein n=1 Tax=Sphaerisporangium sp. B11E5 TaxID=3153563 RepID=UPI00325F0054